MQSKFRYGHHPPWQQRAEEAVTIPGYNHHKGLGGNLQDAAAPYLGDLDAYVT